MKIENVNVLEVSDYKRTIQFRKNDIVEILYNISGKNKKCIGRITFIDFNHVEIDASKHYKCDIRNIRYNDIDSIKLINRENN